MLAVSSQRSKMYLQKLVFNNLCPSVIILMENGSQQVLPGQRKSDIQGMDECSETEVQANSADSFQFRPDEPLEQTIQNAHIRCRICLTRDVNSSIVIQSLKECSEEVFIYAGAGGAILQKDILSTGKKFLHIHPGQLPEYRGSTTIYYSILKETKCVASGIFLNKKIDAGPLIASKDFPHPKGKEDIDYSYDPRIRSELLIDILREYTKTGAWNYLQPKQDSGELYYIIHPVLKHLAILKCRKGSKS